jgi:hypothetical protein
MRPLLAICFLFSACAEPDPCDLVWSGAEPALGTMVLDDGTVLSAGTWAATRLNAGTLTIDMRAMDDEVTLGDALEGFSGTPICRQLDNENDALIYQDNGPWITDASHTGTVAIAAFEGGVVSGRFSATLKSAGQSRSISGAFKLPARD